LVLFCHSGCLLPSADGELPARELTIRVHFRYPSGPAINEPPWEALATPFVATGAASVGLPTPIPGSLGCGARQWPSGSCGPALARGLGLRTRRRGRLRRLFRGGLASGGRNARRLSLCLAASPGKDNHARHRDADGPESHHPPRMGLGRRLAPKPLRKRRLRSENPPADLIPAIAPPLQGPLPPRGGGPVWAPT
jgi:hypothetical protein